MIRPLAAAIFGLRVAHSTSTSLEWSMRTLLHEIQFSLRQLRKSPAFTLVAVMTLALGIGANIAVFSVMNAVLLNPRGVPHPQSLIAERVNYQKIGLFNIGVSAPDFADLESGNQVVSSAAAMRQSSVNLSGDWHYSRAADRRHGHMEMVRRLSSQADSGPRLSSRGRSAGGQQRGSALVRRHGPAVSERIRDRWPHHPAGP